MATTYDAQGRPSTTSTSPPAPKTPVDAQGRPNPLTPPPPSTSLTNPGPDGTGRSVYGGTGYPPATTTSMVGAPTPGAPPVQFGSGPMVGAPPGGATHQVFGDVNPAANTTNVGYDPNSGFTQAQSDAAGQVDYLRGPGGQSAYNNLFSQQRSGAGTGSSIGMVGAPPAAGATGPSAEARSGLGHFNTGAIPTGAPSAPSTPGVSPPAPSSAAPPGAPPGIPPATSPTAPTSAPSQPPPNYMAMLSGILSQTYGANQQSAFGGNSPGQQPAGPGGVHGYYGSGSYGYGPSTDTNYLNRILNS